MKIVIDISDQKYKWIVDNPQTYTDDLCEAIRNGTPLPKGHGRLIDADWLTRAEIMHLWYHLPNGDIACPKVDIDHAPTIIEGSDAE